MTGQLKMTNENAKKKYDHLKGLIAGKLKTGNPVRDDLIVSDAQRHLADLLKKRPKIDFEEKATFETPTDPVTDKAPTQTKPKGKK